jgi:hypothetical protein
MKKISIIVLVLSLTLLACSSSDSDLSSDVHYTGQYAMTAKITDYTFNGMSPFNQNEFSNSNIYSYFPLEDYVLLQGIENRGPFIIPAENYEINIWLKRSNIAVGTYLIGQETFNTPPSHFIDLNETINEIPEYTKNGTIEITQVNTSTKTVVGTFEFTTVNDLDNPNASIDFNVTNGWFMYKYE